MSIQADEYPSGNFAHRQDDPGGHSTRQGQSTPRIQARPSMGTSISLRTGRPKAGAGLSRADPGPFTTIQGRTTTNQTHIQRPTRGRSTTTQSQTTTNQLQPRPTYKAETPQHKTDPRPSFSLLIPLFPPFTISHRRMAPFPGKH